MDESVLKSFKEDYSSFISKYNSGECNTDDVNAIIANINNTYNMISSISDMISIDPTKIILQGKEMTDFEKYKEIILQEANNNFFLEESNDFIENHLNELLGNIYEVPPPPEFREYVDTSSISGFSVDEFEEAIDKNGEEIKKLRENPFKELEKDNKEYIMITNLKEAEMQKKWVTYIKEYLPIILNNICYSHIISIINSNTEVSLNASPLASTEQRLGLDKIEILDSQSMTFDKFFETWVGLYSQ